MSPTEPPPDDDFGYEGQDELYDIPTEGFILLLGFPEVLRVLCFVRYSRS
jgi:hypothetical protein